MNNIIIIYIIIAIIKIHLGALVFKSNSTRTLNKVFLYMMINLSALTFFYGMSVHSQNFEEFTFWHRLYFISYSTIAPISINFFLLLSKNKKLLHSKIFACIVYLPSIIFIYKILTGVFVIKEVIETKYGMIASTPFEFSWYLAHSIYMIFTVIFGIISILWWGSKTNQKREKKQARFLSVFIIITFIMNIILFNMYNKVYLMLILTPLVTLWWALGITYSLVRYKTISLTIEAYSKEIIDSLDLMFLINPDGKILRTNNKTSKLLGYGRKSLLEASIISLIKEKETLLKNKEDKKKLDDCKCELTFICKDKEEVPMSVSVSVLRDKYGDILGYILVGQDIREMKRLKIEIERRKKFEDELRESRKKYRIFFEMCPDFICMIDMATHEIVEANPSALNAFKASIDNLKGKKIDDFLIDVNDKKIVEVEKELINGNDVRWLEIDISNSKGELLQLEANLTPITENGELTKILGLSRDISEKKHAEKLKKKVEEKSRLLEEIKEYSELKNQFIANISHELRTPLNIILGTLQLYDIYFNGDLNFNKLENIKKHSKVMKQNCYRLLRLVNNLIDITKIDAGFYKIDLQNCDIVHLVEEITLSVVEYANNKNRTIIFDTDIEEKIISCDPDKIERILLNLLSNAIKFTEEGDTIKVYISYDSSNIIITVEDTGIGISDKNKEAIFERFTQADSLLTRRNEGSGIGLCLVKSFVEMHDGTIEVDSIYGEGSKFIIKLPMKKLDYQNENDIDYNRSKEIVERINIEFSDIYS